MGLLRIGRVARAAMLAVHCADAGSKPRFCPAWSASERLTAIEAENGFNWLLSAIESDHAHRAGSEQTAALSAAGAASRFESHWAEMLLRFFDFYHALDRSVSTFEAVLLASDEVNRFALPPQYPWLFRACETARDDARGANAERRAACEAIAYKMTERATTMVDEAIGVALMKKLGGVARFGDELTRIDQHHRQLMAAEIDCPSWRGAPFETEETNRLGDAWIDALRAGGEIAAVEEAARACGIELDRIAPLPDAGAR